MTLGAALSIKAKALRGAGPRDIENQPSVAKDIEVACGVTKHVRERRRATRFQPTEVSSKRRRMLS